MSDKVQAPSQDKKIAPKTPIQPIVSGGQTSVKKKKRWPWVVIIIVLVLLLLLGGAGYLVLRTTTFYTWAPLITKSQMWDTVLNLEGENTTRISRSLSKITHTPLTPAEVVIQKQELADLSTHNTEMDQRWEEIIKQGENSSDERIPELARKMERRISDYAQKSRGLLDEEQVAQDRLAQTIGIQEKIDRFLVSKSDPALAGSDITAINFVIDSTRGTLIDIIHSREQLEKDLAVPLDGLKGWSDAQWAYLDALQEFYGLRSAALSTLKTQEIHVRELEDAVKKTDPYSDIDKIDRLSGTSSRNTLQELLRQRKDNWSEIMRWWRWCSILVHMMR